MFTEPQYRRKGIAKELLSRVVNEAENMVRSDTDYGI